MCHNSPLSAAAVAGRHGEVLTASAQAGGGAGRGGSGCFGGRGGLCQLVTPEQYELQGHQLSSGRVCISDQEDVPRAVIGSIHLRDRACLLLPLLFLLLLLLEGSS